MNRKTQFLTRAALIAAIYVVLTVIFAPFGFGEVQVRISEALTILPIFTAAAIPGLFLGCLLGNLLGGAVAADIAFGSLATLIGAVGTYLLSRKYRQGEGKIPYLAALPPIISNAVTVPFVLRYAYGVMLPIPIMMLTVGLGEVLSCGVLGLGLARVLERYKGQIFK